MLTKNVYYATKPKTFSITSTGNKAVVEFPLNVSEVETEEGEKQYLAESVYTLETTPTPNLEGRIEKNYDLWLARAKEPAKQEATLADVIEAVNALTEIIIGE